MKKIIISILAVIGGVFVILIVINFFNKKPPTQTTQLQTKEIVNIFQEDDWGFKIEYPKDWVYEKANDYTVIFSGLKDTEAFYSTLNIQKIASTKMGGKYASVDALLQSLKDQIATAQ